jgi:precorrin-6A/cobalt-precorrin-6A reductase
VRSGKPAKEMQSMSTKILLLGGTTEARQIADVLANCDETETTMSLAGRTTSPASFPIPVRIGGFGGVEGLAGYLKVQDIALLLDATHPFAAQMKTNAVEAARLAGIPIVRLHRPAWVAAAGDRWTTVENVAGAIEALGRSKARNVFLPLGRNELVPFEAAPWHRYLIRSIEAFVPPLNLPNAEYIVARPPYTRDGEIDLLKTRAIDVMVAKNSGGAISYAKILAARALGIEVIVIDRPRVPDAPSGQTIAEVLAMVTHQLGLRAKRVA